jgi:hypothetical protein
MEVYIVYNTDKKDVCDTFNSFLINIAKDIGKGIIFDENNHPSIDRIIKNAPNKPTNTDTKTKLGKKINIKKATGINQGYIVFCMPPMFCLYGIFHIYFSAFVCCKLLFLILCSFMGLFYSGVAVFDWNMFINDLRD